MYSEFGKANGVRASSFLEEEKQVVGESGIRQE